ANPLSLQITGLETRDHVRFGDTEYFRRVSRAQHFGESTRRCEATGLIQHLLGDRHADSQFRTHAAGAGASLFETLRDLVFHEIVEITHRRHAGTLID